jgi:arylsulfate sulfotransferase
MLECRVSCALATLIVGFSLILVGCGGSGGQASISPALITPYSVLIIPGQTVQFSEAGPGGAGNVVWMVNGVAGGSPSTGTITSTGVYTAPGTAPSQPVSVSIQGSSVPATVSVFDPNHFGPGLVGATQNPLVAAYSIPVPQGLSFHVQFGPDTSYGLSTSDVAAPADGGTATVLVAGMRAGTTYHMQAVLDFNGSQVLDIDQTFTTGSIPVDLLPNLTAQTTGVGTPSPGVELLSLDPNDGTTPLSTVATDLDGNVIWYYNLESAYWPYPIKLLPNGHMLLNASPVTSGPSGGSGGEIREIDLAGNIFNTITITQLNAGLAAIGSFQAEAFHHDFAVLPNGHLILLVNYPETINNVSGIPNGTVALGDALVDWDPQQGPVWTWSTFDHLSFSHAPDGLADWTHANAIVYSPDDEALILSMRNQNWVIKINYQNGAGDGSVLWTFGDGGDFNLTGQEAPVEWNYGQHYPTVVSSNSSGVFDLMFFNNGNDRLMNSENVICSSPGVADCYSSVPVFQINEFAKTATVLWENNLAPYYSICCGDALLLPNGNTEFDVAYDIVVPPPNVSHIEEVTPSQELVWNMDIQGQLAYRGFRIPSLYPGQVWSAASLSSPGHSKPPVASRATTTAPSRKSFEQLP